MLAIVAPAVVRGRAAVILDRLVVRVYDSTGVDAPERRRALSRAGHILGRADVDIDWVDCPARTFGRPSRICSLALGRTDLVVRLVNAPPRDDTGTAKQALGYALIDTASGVSTIATVFVDRVAALAEGAKLDRPTVLGRALAHEIGHLILGTNEHTDRGIMRETWTADELTQNSAVDWLFLPTEREKLRQARVSASGGKATSFGGRLGQSEG